ncbi:MAG: NAD(P)/FAD-dependent oxidoreductase [Salinivirgaceae bacterium]|nr:NAD(P)/FAD-dependent oxidoreductase [Salinivirgaceae bacterium]
MIPKQKKYPYLVVGAGIAGLSAVKKIRELDIKSSILIITDEDRLPYKRTKINKSIAKGFEKEEFQLFDAKWYNENNVELCYTKAIRLTLAEKEMELSRQAKVTYGKLLLSQGSKPYIPKINGLDEQKTHAVHFAGQVEKLRNEVETKHKILIVGGSVEGLETANQFIKMGKEVTVVERNQNPLSRFFPPELAKQIVSDLHTDGVDYFDNFHLSELNRNAKGQYQLQSPKGMQEFDTVVVCAGTQPDIQLAKLAGIKTERGICVNEFMQTSDVHVFAAGDVAQHPDGSVTGLWHSAEFQGFCAGENMAAFGKVYQPVPQRLKTSLFGGFYFSANFSRSKELNVKTITEKQGNLFREFYIKDGKVQGLVMSNDKERDKLYQKAVAENWSVDEIHFKIPW